MEKTCPWCGLSKPYSAFGRNRSLKDGLSFYCLQCNRERNNRWYRDKRRARGKEVRDLSWLPDGFRWCPTCRQAVPVEDYTRNSALPGGFGGRCKACHSKHGKDAYLLRTHGITRAELDALRAAQNNRCAICGEAGPGHLDHDHETGETRRLLCQRCNQGLGLFRDNPAFLRAAADYVEFHRTRQAVPSREPTATSRPTTHRPPVAPPVGSGRRRRMRLPADRLCSRTLLALAVEAEAREADG
jgi:hypothetical protein